MNPARRPGRLAAWIAIFAILLAALAPSVARALSTAPTAMPWAEICTVAGTQGKGDPAPASGSGQHQGAGFQHCPFCLSHGGHTALPPAPLMLWVAAATAVIAFPDSAPTPPPHLVRTAARSRAPPAIS
jgi:hypothetical protein